MSDARGADQQGSTTAAFDLLGPLPEGTTVLEASAGTGKTFTIAALVTRYVAEGRARLDELLVVTFGRAATQELRDRVRERLVSARDGLADPVAALASDDALLAHLAREDTGARRRRLAEALASFDSATVATTHEFCHQVLHGLGAVGDVDTAAVLIENLDDLTVEVVQDLYLRMWSRDTAGLPPLTYDAALALAKAVVRDAQAVLVPEHAVPDSPPDLRRRFALAVRVEVERRKRARYLLSFDDLLTRLQATLADPQSGSAAAGRLRARYRVVLVDEFQDTDPVQWDILRLAFHGATTLVLIGDPKQAIYAFRGADVHAYLAAADLAEQRATLTENWRSDPDLLHGLDGLFRGATLGDPRIVVAPVSAGHPGRSLQTTGAPVRIRVLPERPKLLAGRARELVTADVVGEIVDLLDTAPLLTPGRAAAPRPVQPGDLAVIVRSGVQLDLVHAALIEAGVPSVQRTTSSVFRTPAGADWIVLLEALEQPHRTARVKRLALTPFVGWDAERLDTADLDPLSLRVRHWVRVAEDRGVAALLETISRDQRVPSRLLAETDGERRLTDLRHVGEALHAASMAEQLGLTAGLEWLRRRVDEARDDSSTERSRRLDSDAAAVQVVTVHASKGLEFPIVFVPFAWDRHVREADIPLFHDADGRRVRNVGGPGAGFGADAARHNTEEFGEDLRLLYVAMTRAQAQVTAWWAPGRNAECAPLHRLLFSDDPAREIAEKIAVPAEEQALARIAARAVDPVLSVVAIEPRAARRWTGGGANPGVLAAAVLGRTIDPTWTRTSYSALTRGVHDAPPPVGSEIEVEEKDDEPLTPAPVDAGELELRGVPSPLAALPGGTAFGTLVHAVLERVDTTAPDLVAEVRAQVGAQLARFGPGDVPADDLAAALLPSLRTPLGALADGRALADIAPADRLVELDFELPLRGGERPNGVTLLRDVAQLLRDHLPADDPLAPYAELLDDPVVGNAVLNGYLGGSIDVVLRVGGRYLVVDYKTNRLGEVDVPLTAWDYRPDAMAEAMLHAHYPLQALLYDVALHRFLRWRVPGYDPARHLGGVLYLFLRGMCGPGVVADDGAVPGVFAWRPDAALVVALSDVLASGGGDVSPVVAARATGLLAAFSAAGVLAPADVHVARRLGVLLGETDEQVLLAAALTVRGTRQGSVVLDLADAAATIAPDSDEAADLDVELPWPALAGWVAACTASPFVTGAAGGPPLQLVGTRLWLDRYWKQEVQVADDLLRRSADRPADIDAAALRQDLDSLFGPAAAQDQRLAVAVAALSRVAVIAGGPGTGKTTTVAQLIAVLRRRLGAGVRIALAAPTGKAAARLEEAVRSAAGELSADDRVALAELSASTLHRLLGWRPGAASRFRHDRDNHLPYDVVIVDESSMVSLTLMTRLVEALAPHTRLVLVGDPDQLASVEAGAVLGDLVEPSDVGPVTDDLRAALGAATDDVPAGSRPPGPAAALRESVVVLRTVHRFDAGGPIARLAALVRDGAADEALELLRSAPTGLAFHEVADDQAVAGSALAAVAAAATAHERAAIAAARDGDAAAALDALDEHRLLCAHRAGPRGVRHWSELTMRWLATDLDTVGRSDGHYAGQPLLVTTNDYETGLYNGDSGIVVRAGSDGTDLEVAFRRGAEVRRVPLVRLGDVRPLHAMTVHRAQGSQFDTVTVLLPFAASPLATRQTFYTAITRAASGVLLVGSAESVLACVRRPIARATGLRARLDAPLVPVSAP